MPTLYKPLYPPEGAPVTAFACQVCSDSGQKRNQKITKTLRGMLMHLLRKHKVKPQMVLPFAND